MPAPLIETPEHVAEGARWLAAREPRFAHALDLTGPPPLRRDADGFLPLLEIVVSQQLSVAAADGIWRRLAAAGLRDEESLAALPDETLRACGLSAQKVRYARALGAAGLDYARLRNATEDEAIAALTAITGIGRWTAEIYLMFSVGRPDVFAPGDLALQESARLLFGLDARPAPKALAAMAEAWSPWRAVAARLLWAYYRHAKSREGIRA
jgi:DNA-3-methyladenine glycosylase II